MAEAVGSAPSVEAGSLASGTLPPGAPLGPTGALAAPSDSTPGTPPGLRHVEHVMGTVVSIDIRSGALAPDAIPRIVAYLHDVDERFSPFLPESEVSAIADGRLRTADASPDVRFIVGLCDDLARSTSGYFDARRHRPDGRFDPSGVVKGWAIDEAAWMLESAGATDFAINAGGDVVARGGPSEGRAWRVGIRHPRRGDRLAAVLALRDRTVATSGAYERGDHILVPATHGPPAGLLSLTVVGPSLTYADAFATAAFAMGREGIAWVAGRPGYEAVAVSDDDRLVWTPGADALLA